MSAPSARIESVVPAAPGALRLAARTVEGTAWTVFGYGSEQFLRLLGNLVLARLLAPEDFGVMALMIVVLHGLTMFSDAGINFSIIQHGKGDDPRFYNTAWTVQILRGVALWLAASAVAAPMARFYDDPRLAFLIPIGALTLVFQGLSSTAVAILNRELSMRKLFFLSIARQGAAVVVMVSWALWNPSVLALLAGHCTTHFVNMIASHFLIRDHRNRLAWDKNVLRILMGFGKWVFLSTMLTFCAAQADRLIIGKLVTMDILGLYGIAAMLATFPQEIILKIGGTVLFPALSRVHEQGKAFSNALDRVKGPVFTLGGLAVAGLIACGPGVVSILYDDRYQAVQWMLQLYSVIAWLTILRIPLTSALLSLGLPSWNAAANGFKFFWILVAAPLGFHLHGVAGLILGIAGAELAAYLVTTFGVWRQGVAIPNREIVYSLLVAVSAAAGYTMSSTAGSLGFSVFLQIPAAAVVVGSFWVIPGHFAWRAIRKARAA